eukprot:c21030_g1_i1 orf=154-1668(+)
MGEVRASQIREETPVKETMALAAELCRHFYGLGWVAGSGGSIMLKVEGRQLFVIAPSGVQKERMLAEDMYILSTDGNVLSSPSPKPLPHKSPKCSDCAPLFLKTYQMRNAGAVIHSHGLESCLATMLDPRAKEFRITHMEMIKGIAGHGYNDELIVPIIENSAHEYELTDSLAEGIAAYPRSTAVLVRNHGVFIWGDSWISAKIQAECYHYLFEAAYKLYQLGRDPADPNHGPIKNLKSSVSHIYSSLENGTNEAHRERECYPSVMVLDIEGTTTPLSFVTEILFPYARNHVGNHLRHTYDNEETQLDIKLLQQQVEQDLNEGVPDAQPIPYNGSKEDLISAIEANVLSMIESDRKITALKQLQGHIWRSGYANGELKGEVFDDVPKALSEWHSAGTKVYIYSSGSREAQRLLFGNTNFGDLRKFLCGYFDTRIGNKRQACSYKEIFLSVGVDDPSDITFATDVLQEAVAAKEAGLRAVLVLRPGNAPLDPNHGFRTVSSLLDI